MNWENIENLHTDSAYAGNFNGRAIVNDKQSESIFMYHVFSVYSRLLANENAFYAKFGYKDMESFFNALHSFTNQFAGDMTILDKLSANNIRPILRPLYSNIMKKLDKHPIDVQLSIKYSANKTEDQIKGELKKILGQDINITDGTINIELGWDLDKIKQIFNKTMSTHFRLYSQSKEKGAGVRNFLLQATDAVVLSTAGKNSKIIDLRDKPFGYSPEEINTLAQSKEGIEELKNIREEIINFLYQRLRLNHGSPLLQQAARIVLKQTIDNNITDISFFVGGNGDWINNMVGAFGEFQTAVLFQMLAMSDFCKNQQIKEQISRIIGNQSGHYSGQKSHNDVELLSAFGVQVKNYSKAESWTKNGQEDRTITVRLHPLEISSFATDRAVVSYVINSYFNSSVTEIPSSWWDIFFEEQAMELLNLDVSKKNEMLNEFQREKVTFYMIGGRFIPGSVILQKAFGFDNFSTRTAKTIDVHSIITGTNAGNDITFRTSQGDETEGDLAYWWTNKGGVWKPTKNNNLAAWDKHISIQTSFTYKAIWDIDTFKIFKN